VDRPGAAALAEAVGEFRPRPGLDELDRAAAGDVEAFAGLVTHDLHARS
jgi:hypothetical protein